MPNLADTQLDQKLPARLRQDGKAKDVFVMVKANMSDRVLVQPPLLVFPENFVAATEQYWGAVNTTELVLTANLETERKDEIQELLKALRQDFQHYTRAFRYYETLLNDDRPRAPFPEIEFISAGPSMSENIGQLDLGLRPDPPRSHWLEVVFHRG